jgi:hypothetical protein
VEPTGDACRFWEKHEEHIELAKSLGLYEYDYTNGKILNRSGLGEEAGKLYGKIATSLRHGDTQQIERLLLL